MSSVAFKVRVRPPVVVRSSRPMTAEMVMSPASAPATLVLIVTVALLLSWLSKLVTLITDGEEVGVQTPPANEPPLWVPLLMVTFSAPWPLFAARRHNKMMPARQTRRETVFINHWMCAVGNGPSLSPGLSTRQPMSFSPRTSDRSPQKCNPPCLRAANATVRKAKLNRPDERTRSEIENLAYVGACESPCSSLLHRRARQ